MSFHEIRINALEEQVTLLNKAVQVLFSLLPRKPGPPGSPCVYCGRPRIVATSETTGCCEVERFAWRLAEVDRVQDIKGMLRHLGRPL
jgi:hypothetical protein